MLPCFKIMQDLPENPRISLCPLAIMKPSHPVCSSMAITSSAVSRSPFPMTGIFTASFHLTDNVPVCLAGIELLPGPSMHGNCCRTGGFRNLCHLHRIDMIIIKPFADFYRNRFLIAFTVFSMISPASFGFFMSAEPSPLLTIFGTGQPIFRSRISNGRSSI